MPSLAISLFGRLDVRHGQELVSGLDKAKVKELFCYLVLFRTRPHPRESLAELLWGDEVGGDPRQYLRKTLWQLQSALTPVTENTGAPLVNTEGEWIQLNTSVGYWLDIDEFEQAYARIRGIHSEALSPEDVNVAQAAVALYSGHLLDGWYHEWSLYERESFAFMQLAMLDKISSYHESQGVLELAIEYGMQILKSEPTHERTHQRLMQMYSAIGNRAAALRQYDYCVSVLKQELDVIPQPSTQDLYRRIRREVTASSSSQIESSLRLEDLISRLQNLESVLTEAQLEVSQYRQTLETHLSESASLRSEHGGKSSS